MYKIQIYHDRPKQNVAINVSSYYKVDKSFIGNFTQHKNCIT